MRAELPTVLTTRLRRAGRAHSRRVDKNIDNSLKNRLNKIFYRTGESISINLEEYYFLDTQIGTLPNILFINYSVGT